MSIVELISVNYVYNAGTPLEVHSLKNVSFKVTRGETVALVGASGSGKSTLVKHLNGLLLPTKGQVLINGISTRNKNFRRRLWKDVGLVFQYPEHQLFEETVYDDVAFGPRNLSLSEEEVESRVKQSLVCLGLDYDRVKNISPFNLSGGQKRRVAIAGVLAIRPQILVLDEPTAGLDPKGTTMLLNHLKQLQEKNNITVITVTHNLSQVAVSADRLIVLNKGEIVFSGTPEDFFSNEKDTAGVGLEKPPAAELMYKLWERGKPVKRNILTPNEAVKEIIRVFKK